MKGLFAFVGNAKGNLYRMNFLSEENRRTSVLRRSLILKSLFSDFRNVFASGMILFLLCCPILEAQSESSLNLEEGDLIFHESNSQQARAIRLATGSRYTHVGIVFKYNDELKVLEAVEPVKITSFSSFVKRGRKGHYVIKRLRDREGVLTKDKIEQMKKYGNSLLGKHYDIYFGWNDELIYCTELVWKLYDRYTGVKLGELKTLKDFDLSSPAVQSLMKKRYGNRVPDSEPVISPVDMFHSSELITVVNH
ncbi:YiiX family permuted papain-like enzyme [Leptospira santarosai]|uniref:YiiX family permuted papain-like enzyme n=1 Tax=Leptospira santarosai TaxID=28183 RepID=UPI0024AFA5E4|nr:YiiX family permuted papain-like enzyme [Leptospira santarosai]MDI7163639.1 YiiX family permuted papain-like enzyme [Leptospira santarosai]MDI7173573.1 YiiX family permuted papain-like enzyme [Leptospira santarosai]MDI7192281.1 YiiX family permuted papain-like enzyme [Leptospira santarosai]MDO6393359.1 YiiX family permuted papain-like enzyme [Leptospira santarosai]MDO6397625.1 YiiX family permuted papain-like enzyme [Leptospira santarosai]